MIVALVDADAKKPGLKTGFKSKSFQVLVGPQKYFLDRILRVHGIFQHPQNKGINGFLIAEDQLLKSSEVPVPDPVD
jgi:hypothetical protein